MYAAVLIIFFLVLIGVSIQRALQVKTKADFMLAGRKLAWPILVFTLLSSWIGSGSLFGGAESAYKNGLAALWIPAGGWIGLVVIYFIAARARRAKEEAGTESKPACGRQESLAGASPPHPTPVRLPRGILNLARGYPTAGHSERSPGGLSSVARRAKEEAGTESKNLLLAPLLRIQRLSAYHRK